MQSQRVDGLVLNRVRLQDWRIDYLRQNSFPFVSLESSNAGVDYPHVHVEDGLAIQQLVLHLAGKGHRRIAFIGASSDLVIQHSRWQGIVPPATGRVTLRSTPRRTQRPE